jgi:hypothetical protein
MVYIKKGQITAAYLYENRSSSVVFTLEINDDRQALLQQSTLFATYTSKLSYVTDYLYANFVNC